MFKFKFITILFICFLLIGCFSDWQEENGFIVVNFNSNADSRFLANPDTENMEYTILLTNTVTQVTETLGPYKGGSEVFSVNPGTYTVIVRAVGDTPVIYNSSPGGIPFDSPLFGLRMLRGIGEPKGENTIVVASKKTNNIDISMTTATEVENIEQLKQAVDCVNVNTSEIIVLKQNFSISETVHFSKNNTITLVAFNDVTLTKNYEIGDDCLFQVIESATLVLGKPGMTGTIIIDGNEDSDVDYYNTMVYVGEAGTLIMNESVELKNHILIDGTGGAVAVQSGTFTMNGGTIYNNTASYGGAVAVQSGTFTMNGGTIYNNTALYGGGVFLTNSQSTLHFMMTGGTIRDNFFNIEEIDESEFYGKSIYAAVYKDNNTIKIIEADIINPTNHVYLTYTGPDTGIETSLYYWIGIVDLSIEIWKNEGEDIEYMLQEGVELSSSGTRTWELSGPLTKEDSPITITISGDFASDETKWFMFGSVLETGSQFTINPADPRYEEGKRYTLEIMVLKDGVPYSAAIVFYIADDGN